MKKYIVLILASCVVGCAYGHYNVPDNSDAGLSQDANKCDQAYQYMKDCGVDQGLEYCSDCWVGCLNSYTNAPNVSCADVQNRQSDWWMNLNACFETCK